MACFKLNAGRAAPKLGAAPPLSKPGNQTWTPNREPDTLLKCGCTIPWPVTAMIGTGGKQVVCSEHGVQSVTKKEITRCNRALKNHVSSGQLTLDDIPPF